MKRKGEKNIKKRNPYRYIATLPNTPLFHTQRTHNMVIEGDARKKKKTSTLFWFFVFVYKAARTAAMAPATTVPNANCIDTAALVSVPFPPLLPLSSLSGTYPSPTPPPVLRP